MLSPNGPALTLFPEPVNASCQRQRGEADTGDWKEALWVSTDKEAGSYGGERERERDNKETPGGQLSHDLMTFVCVKACLCAFL